MAATLTASLSSSRRRPRLIPCSFARASPASTPLSDHGPFELGKDTHHLKHCPTGRCGGIERLLMQDKIDAFGARKWNRLDCVCWNEHLRVINHR
jgi:hypothetical protein